MSRAPLLTLLATGVVLVGCASPQPPVQRVDAEPLRPAAGEVVAVDRLLVIVDASESVDGETTFVEQRALVESFVASAPDGEYEAGAVAFGGFKRTSIPLAPFDRARLQADTARIEHLRAGTPLHKVLDESGESLGTQGDRAAVVIFSDGEVTDEFGRTVAEERTLTAARELSSSYDGTVCFHTVQIGESEAGSRLLRSISEVTSCGTTRAAAAAATETQLHALQRDVFIDTVAVAAPTPAPPPVSAPPPAQKSWSIQFGFNSDEVSSSYDPKLTEIAGEAEEAPSSRLLIRGHTDTSGDADYNRDLSMRRANATRDALVGAGVDASRIEVRGFGEESPLFADDSAPHSAANRRTDIELVR